MTAADQPGQALFAGFEGTSCPEPLLELIAAGRIGGIVLFARNVANPRQVRDLVHTLRTRAPADAPLVIAIDQEGGRVQRLRRPWTEWPSMRALGALDARAPRGWGHDATTAVAPASDAVTAVAPGASDAVTAVAPGASDAVTAVARALAVELRDCGIGLDFAPVVDVDSNPTNPVIGDRSFGRDPAQVAALASAFITAMQGEGVGCCAKHFPGHGDTTLDSHLALPTITHDLERLLSVELPPFAAAIDAGVASIMSAHVVFAAIDARRPATLSPDVMGLLRERLGFDGLVFSDDLEMKAVADHWRPREIVELALGAGVDALLACKRFDLVTELLARLEAQPDARLENALRRVAAFKRRFALPPAAADDDTGPPYLDHLALAARLVRSA